MTATMPQLPAPDIDDLIGIALWSEYMTTDRGIVAVRTLSTLTRQLGFRCEGFRRQGAHAWARLTITYELQPLTWAEVCIDQPDSRWKLADAAWQRLHPEVKFIVARQELERYVDEFCWGLEVAWQAAHAMRFSGGIRVQ